MASTFYRPNLLGDQRILLLQLIESRLDTLTWTDPEFDALYRLAVKLRDCKAINC